MSSLDAYKIIVTKLANEWTSIKFEVALSFTLHLYAYGLNVIVEMQLHGTAAFYFQIGLCCLSFQFHSYSYHTMVRKVYEPVTE